MSGPENQLVLWFGLVNESFNKLLLCNYCVWTQPPKMPRVGFHSVDCAVFYYHHIFWKSRLFLRGYSVRKRKRFNPTDMRQSGCTGWGECVGGGNSNVEELDERLIIIIKAFCPLIFRSYGSILCFRPLRFTPHCVKRTLHFLRKTQHNEAVWRRRCPHTDSSAEQKWKRLNQTLKLFVWPT